MWHAYLQGALRGEHRAAASLSRLVETAAMHSMHPAAPLPPPSGQLLEPPPALQLDSVAVPTAADAAAAADIAQHGEEGPTPRSSTRVRNNRRGIKAAAAASVRALGSTQRTLMCFDELLERMGVRGGPQACMSAARSERRVDLLGRGTSACQLGRPHGLTSWTPWQRRRLHAASAPPLQASPTL